MAYDPKDPYAATVADMLASCLTLNAGTMKLSGSDNDGTVKWLVLVAVKGEAARLYPEIDRLTADPDERPRKRRGARAADPDPTEGAR